jgi:hypothetical protein
MRTTAIMARSTTRPSDRREIPLIESVNGSFGPRYSPIGPHEGCWLPPGSACEHPCHSGTPVGRLKQQKEGAKERCRCGVLIVDDQEPFRLAAGWWWRPRTASR